ncbi:MAG: LamG-like jellyroll fold domain-containing protein [Candidatus Nanohaloarchaea archaeon]
MKHSKTLIIAAVGILIAAATAVTVVNTATDWNQGTFNVTTAETGTNSGNLRIGYRNGTRTDNLAGYWRFDRPVSGNGGTVVDYSGNGNNGSTTSGNQPTATGVQGVFSTNSFRFDGDWRDNVLIPASTSLEPTSQITLSAWMKPEGPQDNYNVHPIMYSGQAYGFQYVQGSSTDIRFHLNTGGTSSNTPGATLPEGEWSLVTGTYDGSAQKLYINGKTAAQTTTSGSISGFGTSGLSIGENPGGGDQYIGKIDEPKVYSTALTQSQIKQQFIHGTPYQAQHTLTETLEPHQTVQKIQVSSENLNGSSDAYLKLSNNAGNTQNIQLDSGATTKNYSVNIKPDGSDITLKTVLESSLATFTPIINSLKIYKEKPPEVQLKKPETGSRHLKPVKFNFTPQCFESTCDTAALWMNVSGNVTRQINLDDTTDWTPGSFQNTTAASGSVRLQTESNWWNRDWGYRKKINVSTGNYKRKEAVVKTQVNFTEALQNAGASNTDLNTDSIRVIEAEGSSLEEVPFRFKKASNYDTATNAAGTLTWIMNRETAADTNRTYHIYFSTNTSINPPSYTTQLDVKTSTDNIHVNNTVYSLDLNRSIGAIDSLKLRNGENLIKPYGKERENPVNLSVTYHSGTYDPESTGTLKSYVRIHNQGTKTVDYGKVSYRYWFTEDGNKNNVFECDSSTIGSCGTTSFTNDSNGNTYLEVDLPSASVSPGNYEELQHRIHDSDWNSYNQTNDWSYDPTDSFIQWKNITVYYNGTQVWGIEPDLDNSQPEPIKGAPLGTLVNGSETGEVIQGFNRESEQPAAPATTCTITEQGPVKTLVNCENTIAETNYTFYHSTGLINQSTRIKDGAYSAYFLRTFIKPGGAGKTGDHVGDWIGTRGGPYLWKKLVNYTSGGEQVLDDGLIEEIGYIGFYNNASKPVFAAAWNATKADAIRFTAPSTVGMEIGYNGTTPKITSQSFNIKYHLQSSQNPEIANVTDAARRIRNPVKTFKAGVEQFQQQYLTEGRYEKTINLGETVYWNKTNTEITEPDKTDLNISYAENSSGTWNYADKITQLPKSKALKIRADFKGNRTETPLLKQLNITYKDPESNWRRVKQTTNIQNNTENSINLDFTDINLPSTLKWNIKVTDHDGVSSFAPDNRTIKVFETDRPPKWRNQQQSKDLVAAAGSIELSAEGFDQLNLTKAVLATNETGSWQNHTPRYGSPRKIGSAGTWNRTNFTWQNKSVNGETVAWKIYFCDSKNQCNATKVKTFKAANEDEAPPPIYFAAPEKRTNHPTYLNVSSTDAIEKWFFQVDGRSKYRFSPNTSIPVAQEGKHNVTVYAEDIVGAKNRSTREFYWEVTQPFQNTTSPQNRLYHSQTIWRNLTVGDQFLKTVKYTLNGDTETLYQKKPAQKPWPSLQAYYTLDTDKNYTQEAVQNLTAQPNGNVTRKTDGILNSSAYSFDGANDYINLGKNVSEKINESSFTWTAWINTENTGTVIGANQDDYSNRLILYTLNNSATDNHIYVNDANAGGLEGSLSIPDNTWTHVAITLNASSNTLRAYVNGREDTGGDFPATTTTEIQPRDIISIGQEYDSSGTSDFFNGKIDEVQFYSSALTQTEIQQLSEKTSGNMKTYWEAFTSDRNVSNLQLETDVALNAGEVNVTVLSDPDNDLKTEETSNTIQLDGSGSYAVNGLSTDSRRFKLRINASSPSISRSPVIKELRLKQSNIIYIGNALDWDAGNRTDMEHEEIGNRKAANLKLGYSLQPERRNIYRSREKIQAAEGNNTLKIFSEDLHGNTNTSTVKFQVDTQPPQLTLDTPGNATQVERGTVLNYTVTDLNLDTVKYSHNGNANTTDFIGSYDINTSAWTLGTNTVKLYANDTLGETTSKTYRFDIVDDKPPLITLDRPENNTAVRSNTTLNFTVKDPELDYVSYSINGNQNSTDFIGSYDINLSHSQEEPIEVQIYANDTQGNSNTKKYSFIVDETKPRLNLTKPENKTYTTNNIPINYTVDEPNLNKTFFSTKNYKNITITENTTISVGQGDNHLTLYAEDEAGNLDSETEYFFVDSIGPQITIQSPENRTYQTNDIQAKVALDEKTQACRYSLDNGENVSMTKQTNTSFTTQLHNIEYRQHTIKFSCQDRYGNWNSKTRKFTAVTPAEKYSTYWTTPICTEGRSPCRINETFIISKDNIGTNEPNSPNTVDSASDGTSGTYNSAESIEAINITDLNASTFSQNHTVEVSVKAHCWETTPSDDTVNIIYTETPENPNWNVASSQTCPAGGFQTFTTRFQLTGTGNTTVRGLIEYNGGSTTVEQTSGYGDQDDVVIPLDNQPPKINNLKPANKSYIGQGENITFAVNDPENHFDTLKYSVDSGTNQTQTSPFKINTTNWTPGTHTVKIYANDTAGNLNTTTLEYYIDANPPNWNNLTATRNSSETDRIYTGGKINLSANWTDQNTLGTAELATNQTGTFQNSSLAPPQNLEGSQHVSKFTASIGDNQNQTLGWKIHANDSYGNTNTTTTQTLEIWEKANITITAPTGEISGAQATTRCSVNKTLDNDPVKNYNVEFRLKNSTQTFYLGQNQTDKTGEAQLTWNTDSYQKGNYTASCSITANTTRQIQPEKTEANTSIKLLTKGKLNVTLQNPAADTKVAQNKTFKANATVKCLESDCGTANTYLRYNRTGTTPETLVPETGNPLHTVNTNKKTCSLNQGENCTVQWKVNASGAEHSKHVIDVKANSTNAKKNHTVNRKITIDVLLLLNTNYSAIDFPQGYPGETVSAPKNSEGYTVSLDEDSNAGSLWMNMSKLSLVGGTDQPNQIIEPENTSWSYRSTCSYSGSNKFTGSFEQIDQNFQAGETVNQCFWQEIPFGHYNGTYTGTLTIKVNTTN